MDAGLNNFLGSCIERHFLQVCMHACVDVWLCQVRSLLRAFFDSRVHGAAGTY